MSERGKCTKESSVDNKRTLKGSDRSRLECAIYGEELANSDARERFCNIHKRPVRNESQTAQSDPFKYALINNPRPAQTAD